MEDILEKIYYDPSQGFLSIDALYKKVKSLGIKRSDVEDFVKRQEIHQIYEQNKKIDYHPIIGKPESYQIDLMFYNQYARENHNYTIALVIINMTSRKLYMYPLKTKDSKSVLEAFKKFYDEIDGKIKYASSDNGSEFINKDFKKFCQEHNIEQYFAEPDDHHKLGIVNAVIKTIRGMLDKYFKAYGTHNWVDVLPKIVTNYNNREHSSLFGKSPNEITDKDELTIRFFQHLLNLKALAKFRKFNIGDKVRYAEKRSMFAKGVKNVFSDKIYTIKDIKGYSFTLENDQGHILPKTFKYYQLKHAGNFERFKGKNLDYDEDNVVEQAKVDRQQKKTAKELDAQVEPETNALKINKHLVPEREKREVRKPKRYDD